MDYDERYAATKDVFGTEPEDILVEYWRQLKRTLPVLDIGAGQGRNAFFLAAKGFLVDAIDPSPVACGQIHALAESQPCFLQAHCTAFEDFLPQARVYGGILIIGLIPILASEEIALLQQKLRDWTRTGSLILVTGFTIADPSYSRSAAGWRRLGPHRFTDGKGRYRSYLEEGEIRRLFSDYQTLHHWEGMGPEHSHGDGPPHRHAQYKAVFRV